MLGDDLSELGSNLLQRLVPRDLPETVEAALALGGYATHGVEHTIRRIDAVEILRYLGAKESLGNGVLRIALYLCRPAVVDGDEHSTGIRTVVRAGGVDYGFHGKTLWQKFAVARRET